MIYFDNAATTRALPSVAEKMSMMLCEQYGNPASVSSCRISKAKAWVFSLAPKVALPMKKSHWPRKMASHLSHWVNVF